MFPIPPAGRTPARSLPVRRLAFLVLAAALAGCASSRPDPVRAPVAQADTSGPARVGLAATMEIPENPYGDSAAVAIPSPEDVASGAVPLSAPAEAGTRAMGSYGAGAVDPSEVTVSRYYYQDEGTYYYEDVAADLDDYAQGADDEVYYGGYHADYYRYSDPAYYPSPYRFYRPYATYRPYVRFGWYPTWRYRRGWAGYYDPYYAGYGYYDPWAYDPWGYGSGFSISVGFGYGGYGYGGFGGYGYGSGYRDGFYDGYASGYYGPGYYGRPRTRGYDDYRRYEGYDDGRRGRVRGIGREPVAAQSSSDPARSPTSARQPARRGLAPARLPRAGSGGITRSTGRAPSAAPDRRSDAPSRIGRDPDLPRAHRAHQRPPLAPHRGPAGTPLGAGEPHGGSVAPPRGAPPRRATSCRAAPCRAAPCRPPTPREPSGPRTPSRVAPPRRPRVGRAGPRRRAASRVRPRRRAARAARRPAGAAAVRARPGAAEAGGADRCQVVRGPCLLWRGPRGRGASGWRRPPATRWTPGPRPPAGPQRQRAGR